MTKSMHQNGRYPSPRGPLSRNEELDALAPPPAQGLFERIAEHRGLLIGIGAVVAVALVGSAGYALFRYGFAAGDRVTADAPARVQREKPTRQAAAEPSGTQAPRQTAPEPEASSRPPEQVAAPSPAPAPQVQDATQPIREFDASPPQDVATPVVEPVVRPAPAQQDETPLPAGSGATDQPGDSTRAGDAPVAVQNAESFAIDLGSGSSFSELSQRFDEIAQLNQEVPFENLEPRATVEQDGNGLVAHLRVGPFNTPEAAQQACQQLALPAGVECVVSMFEGGRINRR